MPGRVKSPVSARPRLRVPMQDEAASIVQAARYLHPTSKVSSCDLGQGSRFWLELPDPRDRGADCGVSRYAAAALFSTNCAPLVFR